MDGGHDRGGPGVGPALDEATVELDHIGPQEGQQGQGTGIGPDVVNRDALPLERATGQRPTDRPVGR